MKINKRITPIIFVRSLNVNRGGVTKAVLKKANMLSDVYNTVIIVTTLFQQRHKAIIKILQETGELSKKVKVYNFFDDQRKDLPKFPFKKNVSHSIKEKGFLEFRVDAHPENSYRYYKNGYYKKYKRFKEGKLQFIDYMDISGKRMKREEFDELGFLVRERLMDVKTNTSRYDRYFDYKGNCFMGVHINIKTGTENVFVDFVEKKTYDDLYKFQIKWMEQKINKLSNPVIFTEFRGDLDEITYGLKHKNIKKISVIHSSHLASPYNDINKIRGGFRNVLKENKYDKYVFLTKDQKRDVEKVFGENEKYNVIPHSYNTNKQEKNKYQIKRNSNLAVMIARYEQDKRIDEAINAFRLVVYKIPNAKLYIYGKGPLKNELERLIEKLKLKENVFLKGYTNDPGKVYRSANCTLITSRREGFGLIMIESMSQGTPVIAYDFKYGPQEVINHMENGFIVENGNQESLAREIIRLMLNDKLFNNLSKQAMKVKRTFSEDRQLQSWIKVIEE